MPHNKQVFARFTSRSTNIISRSGYFGSSILFFIRSRILRSSAASRVIVPVAAERQAIQWCIGSKHVEQFNMKSILRLLIALMLFLAACAAPVPTPTAMSTSVPTQVSATPSSAPSVGLSGRIVYSNENDIYVMDLADSSVKRLTNDPEWDFDAAWSPDGAQIVFRGHRDGNEEIYVMDADGSNQRNLSRNPGGDWSPVWSPDGTRIAFFSDREGKSGIWLMDTNGGDLIPAGTPPGVNDYPTWSPDSKRIAWNCTMGKIHSNGRGDFEICVANADGGDLTQLTDSEGDNKYP